MVNLAERGSVIERNVARLTNLTARPDVLIVYSGHNEFDFPADRTVTEQDVAPADHGPPFCVSFMSHHAAMELERTQISVIPRRSARALFDRRCCTRAEADRIYTNFRNRLRELMTFCRRQNSLAILVIPAANEADFAPNRSVLPPDLSDAATERMYSIYSQLEHDELPESKSEELLREALQIAPEFAETSFRLGRLCESEGLLEDARRHYQTALDHDALSWRCDSRIADIYTEVSSEFTDTCVLLDARDIIRPLTSRGILNFEVFHDNCHPLLPVEVALADAIIEVLRERGIPVPKSDWPQNTVDMTTEDVCRVFPFNRKAWIAICEHYARLSHGLAQIRYDPTQRIQRMMQFLEAAQLLRAGADPREIDVLGLGETKASTETE